MSSSWENVRVDGSNMRTYVSVPDGSKKVPAIVVVQGQTGVDDFVQFTRMVASEGIRWRGAGSLSPRPGGLQRRSADAAHAFDR